MSVKKIKTELSVVTDEDVEFKLMNGLGFDGKL